MTAATSPRLTGHGTRQNYAPLSGESSLPILRTVGGLCSEVSLGTWEPAPFLVSTFFRSQMTCSESQKVDADMGQSPTSQVRPVLYRRKLTQKWVSLPRPKRDLYYPQTWKRERYVQWSIHPPSLGRTLCGEDSCGGGQVLCAKSRGFLLPGQVLEQTKRSQSLCLGFSTTGEILFLFFCFPIP